MALLLASLVSTACSGLDDAGEAGKGPTSDTAGVPSSVPVPSGPFVLPSAPAEACTTVLENGLAIEGRTRAALRAELGEPDSVAREAVPNRHIPEATDTVVTMSWSAATAVVRVAQSKELVDAIRVTDDRYLRYEGDSIVARLGEAGRRVGAGETDSTGQRERGRPDTESSGVSDPTRSDPETLSYWCPSEPGAESPVLFHLRDGWVAAVEWDFYVD